MRFYRIDMIHEGGISAGCQWETSEARAKSTAATWRKNSPGDVQDHHASVVPVDIAPTKEGILAALRRFASHADNG